MATDTVTNESVLDELDFHPTCNTRFCLHGVQGSRCEKPAQVSATWACCGHQVFICNACLTKTNKYYFEAGMFQHGKAECKHLFLNGEIIFSSIVRI